MGRLDSVKWNGGLEWFNGDKLEKLNVDVDYIAINLNVRKQWIMTIIILSTFAISLDTLNISSMDFAPSLVSAMDHFTSILCLKLLGNLLHHMHG